MPVRCPACLALLRIASAGALPPGSVCPLCSAPLSGAARVYLGVHRVAQAADAPPMAAAHAQMRPAGGGRLGALVGALTGFLRPRRPRG